jgi:hypothetical protein
VLGEATLDALKELNRKDSRNLNLYDRRGVMECAGATVTDPIPPLAGSVAGVLKDAMQGPTPK